jgi:hypothetical protein
MALPALVVRNGRIEPRPWNLAGFYDPLVSLVVDGLDQCGAWVVAINSVAGSEGLYR